MNKLIILLPLFLMGCATRDTFQHVDPSKIQASAEIMKECEAFAMPKNEEFGSFIQALIDNKKVYELCNSQNEAKKKFIEKYQN